jgi:YggT family protein
VIRRRLIKCPHSYRPHSRFRSGLYQARRTTRGITEPVIGPVRRVLKPVRLGSVSFDLAFTAVFVGVIVLRIVVVPLIPF